MLAPPRLGELRNVRPIGLTSQLQLCFLNLAGRKEHASQIVDPVDGVEANGSRFELLVYELKQNIRGTPPALPITAGQFWAIDQALQASDTNGVALAVWINCFFDLSRTFNKPLKQRNQFIVGRANT